MTWKKEGKGWFQANFREKVQITTLNNFQQTDALLHIVKIHGDSNNVKNLNFVAGMKRCFVSAKRLIRYFSNSSKIVEHRAQSPVCEVKMFTCCWQAIVIIFRNGTKGRLLHEEIILEPITAGSLCNKELITNGIKADPFGRELRRWMFHLRSTATLSNQFFVISLGAYI